MAGKLMEYSKFIYPFQKYIIIENSTISLTLKGRPTSLSANVVYDREDLVFLSTRVLKRFYNFLFNFLKLPFKYYCLWQKEEWKKKRK